MSTPFLDFIGAAGAARIAFHSCHNLIVHVVANYLYRPKIFKKVCLYDVLTNHAVRRTPPREREKQDFLFISWADPHPSKSNLRMVKHKIGHQKGKSTCVPCINYLDVLDTKQFGSNKIDSCNLYCAV